MKRDFELAMHRIVDPDRIIKNEPLSNHTSFRIGGIADYIVIPVTGQEIIDLRELCRREGMPFTLIGNGSNLLVSDKGFPGVVIKTAGGLKAVCCEGRTEFRVYAGALLSSVASNLADQGFSGMEFASGIPGTTGGAVFMNAGAYGKEMKDVILEVTLITEDGKPLVLPIAKMEMGYRTSIAQKKNYIVFDALMDLVPDEPEAIRARMNELNARRREKQPLTFPSAGSAFKRPKGHYAGQLIEEAGLRGFQIGGAAIAEKHCGFIVNKDHATAGDVRNLIEETIDIVLTKTGVELEPEIRFLGEF